MDQKEKIIAAEVQEEKTPVAEAVEASGISMDLKDMISSIVIGLFGLYVLFSGVHMSVVSQRMSDTAWYGTPGILPIMIGAVLFSLSIVMYVSGYRKGERINRKVLLTAIAYIKSGAFVRIAVAIGLLAIYVFLLFPYLPFCVATALYLIANMTFFRVDNYPIWKIVVICLVFTVALYLFFGQVAGVPLR